MNIAEISNSLSKKEVKLRGLEDIKAVIDSGDEDLTLIASQVVRFKEYISTIESELRKHLTPNEAHGIKIEAQNTGDRLNYEDDEVYSQLKAQLKERESVLKMAHKSVGLMLEEDNETIITKVGIKTHGKETIKITF